jgi:hypothetical protein
VPPIPVRSGVLPFRVILVGTPFFLKKTRTFSHHNRFWALSSCELANRAVTGVEMRASIDVVHFSSAQMLVVMSSS